MREPLIPQLDAEEYLHWENRQRDRFELHHGFVVAFAGGTVDHDTIAFNLRVALSHAFPPPCRTLGSDVKVKVSEDVVFYPDATVACKPLRGDATVVSAPKIVCEVLSESTRTYDLVDKRSAYRGVKTLTAYVVVHTQARRIEVDTRTAERDWQTTVFEDDRFAIGAAEIPISDVYRLTTLA
jgi:Uma2 family endonuclease